MAYIYALAFVLKQPIQSIYPEVNRRVRPNFHKLVQPREPQSPTVDRPPVLIMWTRLQPMTDQTSTWEWSPNHFVPCVPAIFSTQMSSRTYAAAVHQGQAKLQSHGSHGQLSFQRHPILPRGDSTLVQGQPSVSCGNFFSQRPTQPATPTVSLKTYAAVVQQSSFKSGCPPRSSGRVPVTQARLQCQPPPPKLESDLSHEGIPVKGCPPRSSGKALATQARLQCPPSPPKVESGLSHGRLPVKGCSPKSSGKAPTTQTRLQCPSSPPKVNVESGLFQGRLPVKGCSPPQDPILTQKQSRLTCNETAPEHSTQVQEDRSIKLSSILRVGVGKCPQKSVSKGQTVLTFKAMDKHSHGKRHTWPTSTDLKTEDHYQQKADGGHHDVTDHSHLLKPEERAADLEPCIDPVLPPPHLVCSPQQQGQLSPQRKPETFSCDPQCARAPHIVLCWNDTRP